MCLTHVAAGSDVVYSWNHTYIYVTAMSLCLIGSLYVEHILKDRLPNVYMNDVTCVVADPERRPLPVAVY